MYSSKFREKTRFASPQLFQSTVHSAVIITAYLAHSSQLTNLPPPQSQLKPLNINCSNPKMPPDRTTGAGRKPFKPPRPSTTTTTSKSQSTSKSRPSGSSRLSGSFARPSAQTQSQSQTEFDSSQDDIDNSAPPSAPVVVGM